MGWVVTVVIGCRLGRKGLTAAGERALRRECPTVAAPRVRGHVEVRVVELVDVQPARLAAPVRPRLAQTGSDRHGDAVLAALRDLELSAFGDRALVDVAGDDQFGARIHE